MPPYFTPPSPSLLLKELRHLEAQIEREWEALSAMAPVPVHRRLVKRGKERCPHGPYPYLRVKKEGRWRWQYLGKGWQPPEGFTRAGEFRKHLAHIHRLVERLVRLRELLCPKGKQICASKGIMELRKEAR